MISVLPRSDAKRTKASQCSDGMPRVRQQLTVEAFSDRAVATALVPPSKLMMESDVTMGENVVCAMQTCQEFANRKTTFPAKCDAISHMIDPPEIVSSRLKALRKELGFKTQVEFAEKLGIDKSTYNQYEKGKRALTFETACLIRRHWGISVDWLFFGDLQQGAIQTMAKIGRGTGLNPQQHKKRATRSAA